MSILLDCDGVLCDFAGPFMAAANRITGLNKTVQDLTDWDMLPSYPQEKHSEILNTIVQPGWCSTLRPLPGARGGLEELRKLGQVYCVTAPWTSETWCGERTTWLVREMGFDRHDVIHAHAKWLIHGVTLIDDKPETLVKWHELTSGIGILWSQPYNELFDPLDKGIWRARTWEQVTDYVRTLQKQSVYIRHHANQVSARSHDLLVG